jgi:heme-degrading monooxygenase HmoA
MAKARILNIVATESPSKLDEKFNKWYNEVHIPLLFKYRGLKKVTRYQVMAAGRGQGAKYLAIYEYDSKDEMDAFPKSPEFKAAIDEMNETWKGSMFEIKWAANYEPIKTWEK